MTHTLHYGNLEPVAIDKLTSVFNAAFADYFVPLHLSAAQLQQKMANDSIDPGLSVGAFDGEELVGFILQGTDTVEGIFTVYNGGTGVLPAYRGQGITQAMYRFVLPELKRRGVRKALLEVIDRNEAALKSYKATGYSVDREFLCFRGQPQLTKQKHDCTIQEVDQPDWSYLQTFWDWMPSWQNGITALLNAGKASRITGVYEGDRLVAYAAYNQQNRIAQFAVDKAYRRRGLGRLLLGHISDGGTRPVLVVNIPADATPTVAFLESLGLEMFVAQYEMVMPIH